MIKSLIRTIRGPSQDPVMAYISRPLPRSLLDEEVVAAVRRALEADPRPEALVETLPQALREVTGREFQVLDRSVRDVTGAFARSAVMIREGDVGIWPGHAARAYPLLQPSEKARETRAAIVAADGSGAAGGLSATSPVGKPGWAPPPPPGHAAASGEYAADSDADETG
jgi:hypothetical protein